MSKKFLWLLCLTLFSVVAYGQQPAIRTLPATNTPAFGRSGGNSGLTSNITLTSANELRLEYTFADPTDSTVFDAAGHPPSPKGLDAHTISGINLIGYSRELGVKASTIIIESVDAVEITLPGIRFTPVNDVPLTDDPEADRKAIAQMRDFQTSSVYPAEWAAVNYGGQIGGVPVSTVDFRPYRYDPRRKTLLWARHIVVRVGSDLPINAVVAQDISVALSNSFRSRPKRGAQIQSATPSDLQVAPDGFEYKLFANQDGVYRVSAADLVGLGIPIESIDARTIKLYNKGVEIPIYLYDRGNNRLDAGANEEYFEFFGERKRADSIEAGSDLYYDPYTNFSVYFLVWGGNPGKRMVEEAGDVGNDNTAGIPVVDLKLKTESFLSTIHLEKDLVEADLSNTNLNTFSDRIDRRMYGRISSNTQVSFNVIIPQPNVLSNENVTLTAALRGSSLRVNNGSGEEIDRKHTAEILLQNHRMLQTSFQGDRLAFPSSDSNTIIPLTASILDPTGSGFITVANQYGSTTIRSEAFYANWFDLTYPRLYAAFQNQIEFTVPRGRGPSYYIFSLKGFTNSNIRIYRNGISRIINAQFLQNRTFAGRAADSGTWRAEFQAYVASDKEKFYATTEDLILHPIMVKDSTEGLHNTQLDYNYLVIVDDSTSDLRHYADPNHPIHKFVDFKQSQGYKVKVVRVSDIYDEFNFGSVSPLAIRNFLGYAYHNWAVPPKFVLIFSNGNPWHTADPIMAERNYVPSIMFQTADFGAAPCDYLYGCIDGELTVSQNTYENTGQQKEGRIPDLYPEIFVGRVPVDSREHISAYVDKMISQSQSRDFGEWRNRMILIAGAESEFSSQINLFINDELRYNSEPYRLLTGSAYNNSDFLHVKGLLPVMNDSGAALVTYLGHGGGGQWEDALAFGTKTVGSLHNHNRMSTILSYTCFTGALTTDYGLMSALMVQPEVGAISGVGTASFGWLLNNGYLSEAVFSVLSNKKYRSLSFSELFALGKAKYIGVHQSDSPDQVPTLAAMYSIFGDPSLKVPVSADTVEMHATAVTAVPGQTLTATVNFPFTPTQVTTSLFDTTETPTASVPNARQSVTPVGASMTISRTVPASYNEDYIGIRVYAVDDAGNTATGSIRFATSNRNQVSVRPFGPLRVQQDAVFDIFVTGKSTVSSVLVSLVSATTFVDSAVGAYAVEPGHFRTMPITGYQLLPGARLDVKVNVPDQIVPQDVYHFYVEGGADPSAIAPTAMDSARVLYQSRPIINSGDFEVRVPNPTIHVETSATGPVVTGTLYNWGDRQADNIPFEFYYYLRGNAALRTTIASGLVTIPPFSSKTVSVPLKGDPPVINDIYLAVQPNQSDPWQDAYSGNNISSRPITVSAASFAPALGTTMNGATPAPFVMQHIGTFEMQAGAPAGSGVVTAALITGLPQTVQPFLFAAMGDTTLHGKALQLTAYGTPGDTADVGKLIVRLYPADTNSSSSKELRIVRYNPTTRQWLAYPTALEGPLQLSATVPVSGIYGVSVVVDRQGPEIKYSVEGQFYTDKSAVPGDARFTAVVLDPSGVNTDLKDMSVLLDNKPLVPVRDFVLLDTTATATTTNIRIQTPLQSGHHTLFLQIADKLGNKSSKSTEFDVETDLSVQVFGNFPNPFDTETFLAYEIRGATIVDEVIVQIFTTAGRLVKTMRYPSQRESDVVGLQRGGTGQPNSLGYHEAWWDARDEQGNEVADGVYFYRLRVKGQDQTIERTGVIARKRQ